MKALLTVCAIDAESRARAEAFANQHKFAFCSDMEAEFVLEFSSRGVRLLDQRGKKPVEISVDFTAGSAAHRMRYGGGKSQAIAKAVGVTAKIKPRVLDATAGLGKDAFVLAGLGCEVLMLERAPVAHALLEDGLLRAHACIENELGEETQQLRETLARITLMSAESKDYLQKLQPESVNVVYLDPMFPERRKNAQVKKDMLAFQELVGKDEDADQLLVSALNVAENRVVVKRPNQAPYLNDAAPTYQLKGKSSRFDIYTKKKME